MIIEKWQKILQELRQEWLVAGPDDRKLIEQQALTVKKNIENIQEWRRKNAKPTLTSQSSLFETAEEVFLKW